MTTNKTALIIGAGSDIAKAIARRLASHDYSVQIAGRNSDQLERLKSDLNSRYEANVTIHAVDVTDYKSHFEFISSLPVLPDILVYCAGYMADNEKAVRNWNITEEMIDVNYKGALSFINTFTEKFEERGSGIIVGISSVAGDRGRGSNFIYGSTKAAFTAYLSGLRNAVSHKGIHVITVKPGFVYTKMTKNLNLPTKLTTHPQNVAIKIHKAINKKKNVLYVKPIWRYIMMIIKIIPENIFKRLRL